MSNYFHTRVRPRIKQFTSAIGIKRKRERAVELPPDFDELTTRIFNTVNPYTMTCSRMLGLPVIRWKRCIS
jgi:hypothetical protein